MKNIPFMAYLLVACITLGIFVQGFFEVFNYVIEFENFKDSAALASKVAMNETTQEGVARANNMSDADYYQQKLEAAQGAYGLAQVQDGFIVVDPKIVVNQKYAGLQLDADKTYDAHFKLNMRNLVSKVGMGAVPRYDESDLPNDNFRKSETNADGQATLGIENSGYANGDTSIRYTVEMEYKPMFSVTKKILPFLADGIKLHTTIQPINYIEP